MKQNGGGTKARNVPYRDRLKLEIWSWYVSF